MNLHAKAFEQLADFCDAGKAREDLVLSAMEFMGRYSKQLTEIPVAIAAPITHKRVRLAFASDDRELHMRFESPREFHYYTTNWASNAVVEGVLKTNENDAIEGLLVWLRGEER